MKSAITYQDRAQVMRSDAQREGIEQLKSQFAKFRKVVTDSRQSVVDAVNLARTMGDTIWEITGHEKLLPAEFNQLALALPDAGLAFAKECLSVRHLLDAPVTSYEAARPILDKLMVQLELLPKPGRGAEQSHLKEPVEDFLASVIRIKNESARLIKTKPIAEWPSFYRQSFVREVRPLHDLYVQALEISK